MKKKNRRMHGNVRQSDFAKIAQLCRRHISRDWETSQQAKTSRSRKGGGVRFGASGLPEALLAGSLCASVLRCFAGENPLFFRISQRYTGVGILHGKGIVADRVFPGLCIR